MKTFKKCLFLFSKKERIEAYFLVLMSFVMALIDVAGIASVLPFISLLANPEIIQTNNILNHIFKITNEYGILNTQDFIFASGIFVFFLLVFSISFRALYNYLQIRFLTITEQNLAIRLIQGYLRHDYSWFLTRNSSILIKTFVSDVNHVVMHGLNPLITIATQTFITLTLLVLLTIVDPHLTFIVSLILILAYSLFYLSTKNYITFLGQVEIDSYRKRFKILSETFVGIKEIKIGNLHNYYTKNFSKKSLLMAKTRTNLNIVSQIPKHLFEAIIFGGIILLILYLMTKNKDFIEIVPVLTVFAFAGYRLMPSLQLIYNNIVTLRFSHPSLDVVFNDFKKFKKFKKKSNQNPIVFEKNISLNTVNYLYPNSSTLVLKNLTLNIKKNTTIGLVGQTGSGKTTLIDIILGLLPLENAELKIDDKIINRENVQNWQRMIGYVPQEIYLVDDTVSANIALGVEKKEINHDNIIKACKIANIHKFVNEQLPLKYKTILGDRGVRLSGGQRQRIGIARALYNNPKVLILDEATSSLDNLTEKSVMSEIYKLKKNLTIIIIAHRLSTIKNCDEIFYLEKGKIKSRGNYNKLLKINNNFRLNANKL